jgi:RNA polymerase sigma-70 factor (ECF subfamily)
MNVFASRRIIKETDEAALVEAACEDPQAFAILYRRWISPVYRYLYARSGSATEAEDLTAQVFLAVYQNLPRYRHTGNFAGWLFTIARNRASLWQKQSGREVALYDESQSCEWPDPLKQIIQNQELMQLRQLVQSLPEADRELIYLRYVAELSFPEMAAALQRSESAVKKALYRLQTRLHQTLEDTHD